MAEPLKIAVCEDTEQEKQNLLAVLDQCSIPTSCTIFSSGEALLENYQPDVYDLLLMDIYMGGMTGVEAVTRIRKIDQDIPVAFITTSTEFALESYRLSAIKYIEKPFRRKDLEDTLKLALMEKENVPSLRVQKNGREEKIRLSQILYLEAQVRQVFIYLKDGRVEQIYDKLSNLLPQLEGQDFFSPNKSYAVNLAGAQYIDTELKCFVMENGSNVPIRRETMGKAKKILEEYLFSRTRGTF